MSEKKAGGNDTFTLVQTLRPIETTNIILE